MTAQRVTFGHRLRSNLRAKFALGLALPLFVILATISLVNYLRTRKNLENQMENVAVQLSEVALSSLRHGMLINDQALIGEVLDDMVSIEAIQQAQVVDLGGEPSVVSRAAQSGQLTLEADFTCTVCHQFPASERPRSIRIGGAEGIMRVSAPIQNGPECRACHESDPAHLGILLMDVSLLEMQTQLQGDLRSNLLLSGGSSLLVTVLAYLLSQWLVVRRIERFKRPIARFSDGDFSSRIPGNDGNTDELGQLAKAFNTMAEELERQRHASHARSQVRQRAIVEERDRIARELHDGVAQLLAYVNAKATAARLMVQGGRSEGAQDLLRQLETAAKELYTDVRAAIIGLKATASPGLLFPESLRSYVEWYTELSDLAIEFELEHHGPPPVSIPAETELQVLRITQEALSNARKHSQAASARVRVAVSQSRLVLRVVDDGVGFDPARRDGNGRPHIGLSSMEERAEAIGGQFVIRSAPGQGTEVIVRAPLDGEG